MRGAGTVVAPEFPGEVHADVAALVCQRILVEGWQQRVVFGQHPAKPGVSPLVDVGHVRDHLDDCPFSRFWAAADLLVVKADDQPVEDQWAGSH